MKKNILLAFILISVIFAILLGYRYFKAPASTEYTYQDLFNLPPPGSSQVEIDKHFKVAESFAKLADDIEIKDCGGSPLVYKSIYGDEVTLKNLDSVDHMMIFDAEHKIKLPKNSSINIKAELRGKGLYGYNCDGKVTGFLLIL